GCLAGFGGHHPVGDAASAPIRLSFNPQLRIEFRGATVTSDAGLLLPRESDERLGLSALIEHHLSDPRTGRNSQFPLCDLFRQSIYSRLAGYEDTNDAERLASAGSSRLHPRLVAHEPPAAAAQDWRAPGPARSVLHAAACRKLLDGVSLSSDPRAHRAARVAS